MAKRKPIRINNDSKRNLRIETNKIRMKQLLLPEYLTASSNIKRKMEKEYLRLQLENEDLENQNVIEKSMKNKLFRDNLENERDHANNNIKQNRTNDNNKVVISAVNYENKNHEDRINEVLKENEFKNNGIYSLPEDVRGLSNNKWGGHKPSSITKVKGTFGAASDVRSVSPAVWLQIYIKYCI